MPSYSSEETDARLEAHTESSPPSHVQIGGSPRSSRQNLTGAGSLLRLAMSTVRRRSARRKRVRDDHSCAVRVRGTRMARDGSDCVMDARPSC